MRLPLLLFAFLLTANGLLSQNHDKYFKFRPQNPAAETPAWALKMYSENPNFFEVERDFIEFYKNNEFAKTLDTQNFKFWKRAVRNLLDDQGYIAAKSQEEQAAFYKAINKKKEQLAQKAMPSTWQSLGPFETYEDGTTTPISWQVNAYSLDVSPLDTDRLLAGTEGGGVFLSNNKGLNWTLITKSEVFCNGIYSVKFHPSDDKIFLVGANDRIYRTTDSGVNWTEQEYVNDRVYDFVFDPANENNIFAVGAMGLLKSADGGENWNTIYSQDCWDMQFHPNDNNIAYLLKSSGTRTEFLKSVDGGDSWSVVTSGWYVPQSLADSNEGGGKIGVSPDAPNRVYAALIGDSKSGDNGWIGLYRSDDSGDTFYLPAGQIGSPYNSANNMPWNPAAYSDGYHQGYYNFDLAVSPNDADLLWMGTVRLTESSDGGFTYTGIGAANSNRLDLVHADIQDIEVVGNDIWVASDGGINYSNDNLQSHESRKNGIIGSEYWGFGSGWNEDVLVGGKYHNGNGAYYQTYGHGQYMHLGGVEEATGYVNPLFNRQTYFSRWWTGITGSQTIPENLGESYVWQADVNLLPNEFGSGLFFDKRYADHIYAGFESQLFKSEDGGSSFESIYDFGQDGLLYQIEFAYSNPNVMYATFQPFGGYWDPYEIHKSVDGGISWTKLADVPTDRWRLYISINPADENELWVISRDNNNKVFQTIDGGVTWINRMDPILANESARDILYQGGSDIIYLASTTGVFYFDKSNNTWTDYSAGLPTIANSFQMQPFYKENKLRLATYGRGIWEVDLVSPSSLLVQAITETDSIYCSRDTVHLDSYSIVDQSNVSWEWEINPTPIYLEDANKRNPKVVLGGDGNYDVSLTVTTPTESETYSLADMISVSSDCQPDTIPGFAVELTNSGDFVQLPDLKQAATNTFTITAWVKLNGIQPEYSGIVINDGTAAGLNFREANNTLAYHWPGGQWWWDSGLEVPVGEWAYVALTVSPNEIRVYLNGQSASHSTNAEAVDINSMKIGSYQAWGSRNMNGQIEEVSIWNRTLSEEEIRLNRHITKEDLIINGDDLLAYYQFNSEQSTVMDRVASSHGNFAGDASRVISSAPIGGGFSAKQNVTSAINYDFATVGLNMDFSGNAVLPQNDVYATRINLLPYNAPADEEETACYWIVNNYGNNTATAPQFYLNSPYSDPSIFAQQMPDSTSIVKREENAFLSSWTNACSTANNAAGPMGNYISEPNCSNELDGQLMVKSGEAIFIKLFLEGAYDGSGTMKTDLQTLIPLNQPYSLAPYNYTGTELLSSIPADMVDWVLVELRTGIPNISGSKGTSTIQTKAGVLLADGRVVSPNSNAALNFENAIQGEEYYICIRHRNHLDVLSSTAARPTANTLFDFTSAEGNAWGSEQLKASGDGFYFLHGGDYNQDGTIQVTDYDRWRINPASLNIYINEDGTLDGVIQATDFDLWFLNKAKIGSVEIDY